jgi:hypothetical protein
MIIDALGNTVVSGAFYESYGFVGSFASDGSVNWFYTIDSFQQISLLSASDNGILLSWACILGWFFTDMRSHWRFCSNICKRIESAIQSCRYHQFLQYCTQNII